MTTAPTNWPEMMEEAVRFANENEALMDGTTGPVFEILDANDIVFGIWQAPSVPGGLAAYVVKGAELLLQCIATGQDSDVKWTGIICTGFAQAAALEIAYTARAATKQ